MHYHKVRCKSSLSHVPVEALCTVVDVSFGSLNVLPLIRTDLVHSAAPHAEAGLKHSKSMLVKLPRIVTCEVHKSRVLGFLRYSVCEQI